ncbi:hypothetical protein D3C81_638960 [compost metagenome]
MIEHIPLPVDFQNTSVGISGWLGGRHGSILPNNRSAGINDSPAIRPWSKWSVPICIRQSIIGCAESILTVFGLPAVHQYIFILYLTQGGGFKKSEHVAGRSIVAVADHIGNDGGARFHSTHSRRVQFRCVRSLESPISVHSAVIVNKCSRVKSKDARCLCLVAPFLPVDDLKWPVRPFGFGYHGGSSVALAVRI